MENIRHVFVNEQPACSTKTQLAELSKNVSIQDSVIADLVNRIVFIFCLI